MIKVNAKTCTMMIDNGATVNILDDKTHKNIGSPKLSRNDTQLLHYGGSKPLDVTGACELEVGKLTLPPLCYMNIPHLNCPN
jgi:hypothetical protein